jgi:hypothetical protein
VRLVNRRAAFGGAVALVALTSLLLSANGIKERLAEAHRSAFDPNRAKDRAKKTHRGPGLYRRYVDASTIPKEEIDLVASSIVENGFKDRLVELGAVSYAWSEAEERKIHGRTRGDEARDLVLDELGFTDRFWLRTIGRGHLEAIRAANDDLEGQLLETAGRVEPELFPQDRGFAHRLWTSHPEALSLAAVPRLWARVKELAGT